MKLVKNIKIGKNSFFLILIFLKFFLFHPILKSEINSQVINNEQMPLNNKQATIDRNNQQ